jgi:hypothetical protein
MLHVYISGQLWYTIGESEELWTNDVQCVERRSRPKFSGCAPPVSKERKGYKMDLFAVVMIAAGFTLMVMVIMEKRTVLVRVKK